MSIGEKVAYLKGLMEGLKLEDNDQNRILKSITDVLEELAGEVESLRSDTDELTDYVDELDYDLGELEEYAYGDECDCCDDDEHEYCDGECDCCDEEDCEDRMEPAAEDLPADGASEN